MLKSYLAAHPKKYLIFDFDETLFTLQLPWEIYAKELTEQLFTLDQSLHADLGKSLNDLENEAVRRHGEPAVHLRRSYAAEFEKKYLQGVEEHFALTNFIRETMPVIDAQGQPPYVLYLWTSNMRDTVEPVLIKTGLRQYFTALVTKSDVELTKPEPEGFYTIFDPTVHHKNEFLLVGDSINDAGAASNAGIDFFKVTH